MVIRLSGVVCGCCLLWLETQFVARAGYSADAALSVCASDQACRINGDGEEGGSVS
jgi:hypothetical protein